MIDTLSLRRFFMGVMRWTPSTVMQDASVFDLRDAMSGYAGIFTPSPPKKDFLNAMMNRFPDRKDND